MLTVQSLTVLSDHPVPVEPPPQGGSAVVTVLAGDVVYYADSQNVLPSSNQGTLTAGQSVTFTVAHWLLSASRSDVGVVLTDPPIVSGGSLAQPTIGSLSYLPFPTGVGVMDTANLNAVLARGGTIRPNPLVVNPAYVINGTLVTAPGGNTDVDFGEATITMTAGVGGHMLENAAFRTTGRNVPEVTVTSGVANVTCVQAPQNGGGSAWNQWTGFYASDVGKTIVVRDLTRPQVSGDLTTTITAVSGSTAAPAAGPYATATLAVAPSFTPAFGALAPTNATFCSVGGPRDQNIAIRGGTWKRTTITNNPQDLTCALIWLERVDDVVVRDINASTQTGGSYHVAFADVTNYLMDNMTFATTYASVGGSGTDGCHINGPATNGVISNVFGTTSDDGVGLNAINGTGNRTSAGPITKLTVRDIFVDAQSASTIGCWCADWYNATIDDLTVECARPVQTAAGLGTAGTFCSFLTGEQHQILAGTVRFVQCQGRVQIATNLLPSATGNGTIAGIKLVDHRIDPWMMAVSSAVVQNRTAVTIGDLQVLNFSGTVNTNNGRLVHCNDTSKITSLLIDNVNWTSTAGTTPAMVQVQNSGGSISRLRVRGGQFITSNTGTCIIEQAAGADTGETWISDFYTDANSAVLLQSNQARTHYLSNVHFLGSNGYFLGAGTSTTFKGKGVNSSLHTLNSGCHVQIEDMQIDVGLIGKAAGDRAYNTNSASAPVGPVYTDGTTWFPIMPAIVAAAYSASITPNAQRGSWQTITVTNTTAFTINAPSNPPAAARSAELTIEVLNSSGGVMGAITWNAVFKFPTGAWANPANTFKRFARFEWNGANWICTELATADY